jgi:AcrR family transcriptional regulator
MDLTIRENQHPAPRRGRPPGGKGALTPDDWLRVAADVLVDKSVEGVRVDVLARTLNVTRGSFYWHFIDRDDLLQRLLQKWRLQQTEQVIAANQRQGVTAQGIIHELTGLPMRGDKAQRGGAIELAIRAWARRDPMARAVVDEVDQVRLEYIAQCFRDLGFCSHTARHRAFLLYAYLQSESIFRSLGDETERAERRAYVESLLSHPASRTPPFGTSP